MWSFSSHSLLFALAVCLTSSCSTAQVPPGAPKNIRVLYVTATSLTYGFDKVSDGGSNGVITGYRVYYRAENGTDDSTKTMDISKSSTLFVLSGLKENIMYRVWMNAIYLSLAGQSQPMLSMTAKSWTDVPQNMTIVRYNATAATVSWNSVSGAIRYRVCVQQHQVSSSQSCKDVNARPGVVRFQVLFTGLVPGQNYTSTVQSVVNGGSIDFGVQPQNATSVLIVRNPVSGATEYQICYQESGVNKEMFKDVPAGLTLCKIVPAGANNQRFEFRLDGLKPNTTYQFFGLVFFPARCPPRHLDPSNCPGEKNDQCSTDSNCAFGLKCCIELCDKQCVQPVIPTRAGIDNETVTNSSLTRCPPRKLDPALCPGERDDRCSTDNDCSIGLKCCIELCDKECVRPMIPPTRAGIDNKTVTNSSLINGGWSDWSGFGQCSVSCGRGLQIQTRTCTNPRPAFGGKNCTGCSIETRPCVERSCPTTINKTFEVDAGNNQVLPCRSSTPNDLRWKRGGQFLPSESLRVTKLSNGSLLVRNVSTIDSGYYLCVAPNDRILYNVTINVKVKVEVQMELRILNVKYSEDFKNSSSEVYKKFEKNFTDTMDVVYNKTEGYQETIILDIRNGSTKVDFKVVIARVIKKPGRKEPEIKVEVAGKIIAKITKEKGYIQSLKVDVDPKTLQLKMAPPAPKEPQMVDVKATSVVIQWDVPEFHKYYHINGYIVGLKKFGSGHEWVNKTIAGTDIRKYILTNLKPETGYYVNVAATNQHGRGVATQPQALTTETAGLAGWAVALIVIVLVVLVAVLVVVLWYRMKYKPKQERRRKLYLDMAMEQTKSNPYDDSQKVKRESLNPKFSEVDGNWHKISWENLQLSTVLGSGAFGKVYKGQVLEGDKTVECAVKTLKANATEEEKRDLYKELEIMSSVGSHPNLVNLIGACSKEDTLYIAIEFAANGCLHDYLKNNRLGKGGETQTTTSQIKKHTRLILALDVANGMAYLASKRCIHRDLAARNVLLTEEYRGKIADFGMSRDIYSEGVYEKKTTGKLPVRWMALEAIETFMFTAETDVWSYGVLLWEIETGGITPWSGLNAKEIVDTLKNGGRLEQPPDCNQEIYEIMLNCWDANPKQRPSFKDLADRFEKLLDREQTDEIGVNRSYEDAI